MHVLAPEAVPKAPEANPDPEGKRWSAPPPPLGKETAAALVAIL
jgi:hypothetical protein